MKWPVAFLVLYFSITNFSSNAQCNNELIVNCISQKQNVTYLKEFIIRLPKARKKKQDPRALFSVMLNKGTNYHFNICNDTLNTQNIILKLYDDFKSYGGNIRDEKEYFSFDFKCRKTQVYYLVVTYNGNEGCGVVILSHAGTFNIYDRSL